MSTAVFENTNGPPAGMIGEPTGGSSANRAAHAALAKPSRVDLLREAKALEELGAEWLPAHAAAFCVVSPSFLRRSTCPKLIKRGTGRTGKPMITYLPDDVRRWNVARTRERTG